MFLGIITGMYGSDALITCRGSLGILMRLRHFAHYQCPQKTIRCALQTNNTQLMKNLFKNVIFPSFRCDRETGKRVWPILRKLKEIKFSNRHPFGGMRHCGHFDVVIEPYYICFLS